ncbi:hypothetical protein [Leisingera sp. ANG-M6]|uniref:hypothetical protein n=1 Tax=Leisingera sp. ANG-M6 TaxID=1577900 RepID=UPI00187C4618|nr:hypothetical protein [Leisingera sp. ANG-M6]
MYEFLLKSEASFFGFKTNGAGVILLFALALLLLIWLGPQLLELVREALKRKKS